MPRTSNGRADSRDRPGDAAPHPTRRGQYWHAAYPPADQLSDQRRQGPTSIRPSESCLNAKPAVCCCACALRDARPEANLGQRARWHLRCKKPHSINSPISPSSAANATSSGRRRRDSQPSATRRSSPTTRRVLRTPTARHCLRHTTRIGCGPQSGHRCRLAAPRPESSSYRGPALLPAGLQRRSRRNERKGSFIAIAAISRGEMCSPSSAATASSRAHWDRHLLLTQEGNLRSTPMLTMTLHGPPVTTESTLGCCDRPFARHRQHQLRDRPVSGRTAER